LAKLELKDTFAKFLFIITQKEKRKKQGVGFNKIN